MNAEASPTEPKPRLTVMGVAARILLPLLVLGAGGFIAVRLMETSPKAQRKPPPRQARLVEVQPVKFSRQSTLIPAMGAVQPAREIVVYPRVSGEIVRIADEFLPGGRFQQGDPLIEIDSSDFKLAVQQRQSDLAQAQSALDLELGQQAIARNEYELLGETIAEEDRRLVLRQPQLEQVRARVSAAQAALEQAKLNLERTQVKAPFNATIRVRNVNRGAQVTPATPLATLTGSDEYWVEASVRVDQLRWIRIPQNDADPGSAARVFSEAAWGANGVRLGQVIRLLPDLEREGRMARLLVAVKDPLALQSTNAGKPKLALGDYVRIEIDGIDLEAVAAIDRRLFRDGDRVWIMTSESRLEIRPVEVIFRGREQLLVRSGLKEGEQLITTDLPAAVDGMQVRTAGGEPGEVRRPEGPSGDRKGPPGDRKGPSGDRKGPSR